MKKWCCTTLKWSMENPGYKWNTLLSAGHLRIHKISIIVNMDGIVNDTTIYMVFLLVVPVCCGTHSNCTHVIRNYLICFIKEGLFCLYNGRKTDRIWYYIFQRGKNSIVAIGPAGLCLVKIYIHKKQPFLLKMLWHRISLSKICHISPSYTIGHSLSNDIKHSMVCSSHLSMMETKTWCDTS